MLKYGIGVGRAVNEGWDLPDPELVVAHEEKQVIVSEALYIMKLGLIFQFRKYAAC